MKRTISFFICTFLSITTICSQELPSDVVESIKQRYVECYNDFISYLPEIAAKSSRSMEERKLAQKYIEKALNLFVGSGEVYHYYDEQGELRMHKAVSANIITADNAQFSKPSMFVRVFLHRLMAMRYQYKILPINKEELVVTTTRNMPENALYSIVDKNKTVIAYVFRKFVETPDGDDSFYFVKLSDITLIQR